MTAPAKPAVFQPDLKDSLKNAPSISPEDIIPLLGKFQEHGLSADTAFYQVWNRNRDDIFSCIETNLRPYGYEGAAQTVLEMAQLKAYKSKNPGRARYDPNGVSVRTWLGQRAVGNTGSGGALGDYLRAHRPIGQILDDNIADPQAFDGSSPNDKADLQKGFRQAYKTEWELDAAQLQAASSVLAVIRSNLTSIPERERKHFWKPNGSWVIAQVADLLNQTEEDVREAFMIRREWLVLQSKRASEWNEVGIGGQAEARLGKTLAAEFGIAQPTVALIDKQARKKLRDYVSDSVPPDRPKLDKKSARRLTRAVDPDFQRRLEDFGCRLVEPTVARDDEELAELLIRLPRKGSKPS